jgi:hypothetical protein
MRTVEGWATWMRSVIVYGNTAAMLSEDLVFMRDNLPVFQQIKAQQTLDDLTPERIWTEGVVRQAYDTQRSLRAVAALLRRAEEGELAFLQDESPRTEGLRNARLRAGIWTALLLLSSWLAVVLRDVVIFEPLSWSVAGVIGALFCVWRLILTARRLRG